MESRIISFLLITLCVSAFSNSVLNHGSIANDNGYTPELDAIEYEGKYTLDTHAEFVKSIMDTTADPCEEFYQYACGNFEKLYPISEKKVSSTLVGILNVELKNSLIKLLENIETNNHGEITSSNIWRKAKYLYDSCMDYERLKDFGIQPLLDFYQSVGGWHLFDSNIRSEERNLYELAANISSYGFDNFFPARVSADLKNPTEYIVSLDQTDFQLLARSTLLGPRDSKRFKAYINYLETLLILLGVEAENAKTVVREVIDFEVEVSKLAADPRERANLALFYNRMTINDMNKLFTEVDWVNYFTILLGATVDKQTEIVVYAREFIPKLIRLIEITDPKTIENYLFFDTTVTLVEYLDDRFEENERKLMEALSGTPTTKDRNLTCLDETNNGIEDVVSALYVRTHFNEQSKNDVLALVNHLQKSYTKILLENEWIDDVTRTKAIAKLNATKLQIGYPDYLLSDEKIIQKYEKLEIVKDRYFQNILNVKSHEVERVRNLLGTKVDHNEWRSTPTTVNAFYAPVGNKLIFPAASLQPPLYSRIYPNALNYGQLGAFVGHEMTHTFGDRGRLFNAEGAMESWFSDKSLKAYDERESCFKLQYNRYTYFGHNINGNLSVDENVADNSGLHIAYEAYKDWLNEQKATYTVMDSEKVPGLDLNRDQLFFLSFAQLWCGSFRPEMIVRRLRTNTHSPSIIRVKGVLSNSADFARAFNCPQNSTMNPILKCKMW